MPNTRRVSSASGLVDHVFGILGDLISSILCVSKDYAGKVSLCIHRQHSDLPMVVGNGQAWPAFGTNRLQLTSSWPLLYSHALFTCFISKLHSDTQFGNNIGDIIVATSCFSFSSYHVLLWAVQTDSESVLVLRQQVKYDCSSLAGQTLTCLACVSQEFKTA